MGRYDRTAPDLDDPAQPWSHVVRRVGDAASVLDLGCWDGRLARMLAERGKRVRGVERDAAAAERARARGVDVVTADLEAPGWERALGGERFEAVVLADVVEHVRDPGALLRVVRDALLAPGGTAVLSVPNVAHGSVRLSLLLGDFDATETGLLDATHLRFFTRRSLLALLRDAGFRADAVDVVPKDVPETLARAMLARKGLADPALVRLVTADPDAVAYQFVVAAVPAAPSEIPPPPAPVAVDVPRHLDRVLRSQAAKIRRLEERLAVLEAGTPFRAWRYLALRARQVLGRGREGRSGG
jgi:2-polyprenyl-3-methyl-5-hydroxy-6-metoxy-1,4-benzoquinol methylase